MVDDVRPAYADDEIDLFELIETLWREKVLIFLFVLVSALCGAVYAFTATPKFAVSVNYTVNPKIYAGDAGYVANRFLATLPEGWGKDSKKDTVTATTLVPESDEYYADLFSSLEVSLSTVLLNEAQSDVDIILRELPEALQATEAVALQMLKAKQTIRALTNDSPSVTFSHPRVVQTAPKKSLILALSIVLGGMIGVLFVLIRSAVRKRKAG